MTLTNDKLINALKRLGSTETEILSHVERYIDDRLARKEYHRKYNAQKNALLREVKSLHPELFKKVS